MLELSKLHMYKFYDEVLKPRYDENIDLGYTDTYSLVIKVKTDDIYEYFKELNDYVVSPTIQKTVHVMTQLTKTI